MRTHSPGPFKQIAIQRPVESAPHPPARPLTARFGLLAERPEAGFYERELSSVLADRVIVRQLGSSFGNIVEYYIKDLPELTIGGLCSSWSILGEAPIIRPARPPEPAPKERDAVPFMIAVQKLIEAEQLVAAREMLNAAPTHILTDPLVVRLRSILAPPVVKRVQKRDVDRSREYEWLETEGHKHRGHWVALDGDRLLAVASSLRELREQLRTIALTHPPLLHRVD